MQNLLDAAGTPHRLRLQWGNNAAKDDEISIFVGDLGPKVTDEQLRSTFAAYFPRVRGAKVVLDQATGKSKGFGFVRFGTQAEADKVLARMNFVYTLGHSSHEWGILRISSNASELLE